MSEHEDHPWQGKSEAERNRILDTVKGCGSFGIGWEQTAALVGVASRTLRRWKNDDPKGLIQTAYDQGMQATAEKLSERLQAKALNPDEEGNTQALIHATKHFMRISEHQTTVNVDAGDVANAKPDEKAKWREALSHLGLEALVGGDDDEG